MTDTLASRTADIANILSTQVYISGQNASTNVAMWNTLAGALPSDMTLDELILFLAADTETDQQKILDLVSQRISGGQTQTMTTTPKHIRILTMHGAKGLSGKVVFIPSAEQGIMPNFKALQATGLVIEQRRLFYVSLTRAMACCIISHSAQHTGAASMALTQSPVTRLTRSQFLNEMGVPSVNRTMGLTSSEAAAIVAEVNNL